MSQEKKADPFENAQIDDGKFEDASLLSKDPNSVILPKEEEVKGARLEVFNRFMEVIANAKRFK